MTSTYPVVPFFVKYFINCNCCFRYEL